MKKSDNRFVIHLFLVSVILMFALSFISAGCTITFPHFNSNPSPSHYCAIKQFNATPGNDVIGCVPTGNENDCSKYETYGKYGGHYWRDGDPKNDTECKNCMGSYTLDDVEQTYYLQEGETQCSSDNKLYQCTGGNVILVNEQGCCSDSDGGKNIYKKGIAEGIFGGQQSSFWDACCVKLEDGYSCHELGGDSVLETFCEGQYIRTEQIECLNGCSDGACLPATNGTCTDTDGGIDYFNFGIVNTNSPSGTFRDSCISSLDGNGMNVYEGDRIVEYFCASGTWSFSEITCEYGCRNGTCITQYDSSLQKYYVDAHSNSCMDTDSSSGYYSYFTKGTVTHYNPYYNVNESFADGCTNDPVTFDGAYEGTYLAETNCRGSFNDTINYTALSMDVYKCPNGCVNGACFLTDSTIVSCDKLIYHPEQNINEPTILDRINFCKNNSLNYAGIMLQGDQFHWYGNCLDNPNTGWGYITDLRSCNYKACTDSDGGINHNIKGNVVGYANSPSIPSNFTDTCALADGSNVLSGPNLVEGYCENNFWATFDIYTCPYGCSNGVCKTQNCLYNSATCPTWTTTCDANGKQYCTATGCSSLTRSCCAYTAATCPSTSWSTCSGGSQYCTVTNCNAITRSCCAYTALTCPTWTTTCDANGYQYCTAAGCSSLTKNCGTCIYTTQNCPKWSSPCLDGSRYCDMPSCRTLYTAQGC